ncbi:MAG: hypothetical protein HFE46_04265 [Clostridia bacterium]|nr:hypothetical protein [Clostridia bacterium]
MSAAHIVVIAVLSAAFVAAVIGIVVSKVRGKGCCGGCGSDGCAGCPHARRKK